MEEIKLNFSVCHSVKTYWGSGGKVPLVLKTSSLDEGEWSDLRFGRFTPDTH
jgi:hypothetical protein